MIIDHIVLGEAMCLDLPRGGMEYGVQVAGYMAESSSSEGLVSRGRRTEDGRVELFGMMWVGAVPWEVNTALYGGLLD